MMLEDKEAGARRELTSEAVARGKVACSTTQVSCRITIARHKVRRVHQIGYMAEAGAYLVF
jgi:hypothetical protein